MKIIEDIGMKYANEKSKHKRHYVLVECPCCQKHFSAILANVKRKNTTKCDICADKKRKRTHGESGTRLYSIWDGIKGRCSRKTTHGYRYYGGKGISICAEWREYVSFRDWSLANGYADELTIDRIDSNKNYEPSNCQWITARENTIKSNYKRIQ